MGFITSVRKTWLFVTQKVRKMKLAAVLPTIAFGAYCHGGPNPSAARNEMPILTQEPVFDREIQNAKAWSLKL